jgi:hypothetical protein
VRPTHLSIQLLPVLVPRGKAAGARL